MPSKHLVFYDGECGLCDQVVQFLLKADKKKRFLFAPLQGKTAKEKLKHLPEKVKQADSLILIENFGSTQEKIAIFGKGAFRILWLLGGGWRLLGWISFLPAVLYDWGYRVVAKNRHRLFPQVCVVPTDEHKTRFLE